MPLEMQDVTGEPRGDDEIREAVHAVEKQMIDILGCPAEMGVQLATIRDGLREVLFYRTKIREANERKHTVTG